MNNDLQLNGSDCLMLGFDHELRRHGFAGNSCQIVLELDQAIFPAILEERLDRLSRQHAVLRAHPGGFFRPHWKLTKKATGVPQIRIHADEPGLCQRIFNEPLAIGRGELVRFDLIKRAAGRMTLIFTWAHVLMDAPGAEFFLTLLSQTDGPLPGSKPPPSARPRLSLQRRCQLAWKSIHQLDEFCKAAPRSLGPRHARAPSVLNYRTEKFSLDETRQIRERSARLCGVLGDAQYHAAVSVLELHRLHERLGRPSPGYVVPVPVGLRRKGALEPLFGNHLGMLMFQFLPVQLASVENAVVSLKRQTEQAMRGGMLDSGLALAELFRFLPRSLYIAFMKHGLRGEICSLFFGDTGAVNSRLENFLGVRVTDFTHVAAVVPSPGLSVIYYYFGEALRVTVVHSARVLNEAEASEFAAGLRVRLLNP
jgi:hypothetical protein